MSLDGTLSGENPASAELEIRKLRPDAKVVMTTACSVNQMLRRAQRNGAAGVPCKPFKVTEFLALCDKRGSAEA